MLVELLDSRPDAWAVTPWFRNPDGSPQWFWRRLPGPGRFPLTYLRWGRRIDRLAGRRVWRWRSYRDLDDPPPDEVDLDAVGAAFLLARRDDLIAAGSLDERYFNFFSDAELMRDRARAGRRLVGTGNVEVVHDRGITFRSVARWQRDAEFLGALTVFVGGERWWRRWPIRAAIAVEVALPHRDWQARRRLVRAHARRT